jgi:hypothetical protein
MFFPKTIPHFNINKYISQTLSTSYTTMSTSRSTVKAVYARETPEGVGAIVRRSIGSPALKNLSPFLMYVLFSHVYLRAPADI